MGKATMHEEIIKNLPPESISFEQLTNEYLSDYLKDFTVRASRRPWKTELRLIQEKAQADAAGDLLFEQAKSIGLTTPEALELLAQQRSFIRQSRQALQLLDLPSKPTKDIPDINSFFKNGKHIEPKVLRMVKVEEDIRRASRSIDELLSQRYGGSSRTGKPKTLKALRNQREHKKRNAEAKKRYAAIVNSLGGKCDKEDSSCRGTLQLDHVDGIEWEHASKNQLNRVKIMEREATEGKLRVLCAHHNQQDGAQRKNSGYKAKYREQNA